MKKYLIAAALLTAAFTDTLAQRSSQKIVLSKAFAALQKKDYPALQACLSDSCTMAGLNPKTTREVLPQVVGNYSGFSKYEVSGVINEEKGTRINLLLSYTQGNTGHPNILLDNHNKIIELNIIKDPKVSDNTNVMPDKVTLPITRSDGSMFFDGIIDGISGQFMVDNGAFGLIVNQIEGAGNQTDVTNYASRLSLSGVNGRMEDAKAAQVKEISIAGIRLRNLRLMALPLEETVGETEEPLLGLLGYDFLRHYNVTFDWKTNQILLERPASGQLSSTGHDRYQMSFEMERHLPVITCIINGETLRLALDCGASHNVIYKSLSPVWRSMMENIHKENLSGADGRVIEVETGSLKGVNIAGLDFKPMPTAFSDKLLYSPTANNALKVDGILGMPFFSAYRLKIDYANHRLFFN
jgi:hypothetical protein